MPMTTWRIWFDRVQFADVLTAGDLVHVSLEVLRTHAVVDSVVGSLEHGPKALDRGLYA